MGQGKLKLEIPDSVRFSDLKLKGSIYRVYLKTPTRYGNDISRKTICSSPLVAVSALREIMIDKNLQGSKCAAVLSRDNVQQLYHRFDRRECQADFVSEEMIQEFIEGVSDTSE